MRWRATVLLLMIPVAVACLAASAGHVQAQSKLSHGKPTTLASIRARGVVACGSVGRPGLAARAADGTWSGLHVEICRALAAAVFGPAAPIAFHGYDSDAAFSRARNGGDGDGDDVAFLSFAEMAEHGLADALVPGPAVFVETHDLLVAADGPVRYAADLATRPVCFIIASAANDSLEGWFGARHVAIVRYAFREEDEMADAYAVGRCGALAGEATTLAQTRLDGGVNHLRSRFLPEHLASFPIVAATPLDGDAQWAAVVAWTVATLRAAETADTPFQAGGLRALPVAGAGLGLAADWQAVMVASVGDYGAIYDRTLGAASPLKLDRGLNASGAEPPRMPTLH